MGCEIAKGYDIGKDSHEKVIGWLRYIFVKPKPKSIGKRLYEDGEKRKCITPYRTR